jgi:hypothetical protein
MKNIPTAIAYLILVAAGTVSLLSYFDVLVP